MTLKLCTRCNRELPATTEFFSREKSRRDGLYNYCKECCSAYLSQYRARNADALREKKREYYNEHAERICLNLRTSYANSAEIIKERARKYKRDNPTQVKAYLLNRLARKRALPAFFTAAHWQEAVSYFEGKCAVCGRPAGLWHTLAADHWVPISSPECPGTVPTNMVPLCHGIGGCNNSKHNKPAGAWLVETFGPRKARAIEARVQEFFQHMAERFPQEEVA